MEAPRQNSHIEHEQESPIKQSILIRVKWLYIIFLCLAIAVLVKLVLFQFGEKNATLKDKSELYSFRNDIIEAARGDILSDDYRAMATSVVNYDLRMDLGANGLTDTLFNNNVAELATDLADFFKDKSAADYLKGLREARKKKSGYYRIAPRKVNYLELGKLMSFPLLGLNANKGGFIAIEQGRRQNPYGALAARTIGFVNSQGVKVGLEGSFDDQLRGKNGMTVKQKISGDFWIPVANVNNIDPVNGYDVVTTINIEIQNIVQRALYQQLRDAHADWGTAIVMETQSGDIKAIANGTRLADGQVVEDYNYAVGMSLEPGSTFKLVGLMALLDDAKAPINMMVDTEGGRVQIGSAKVVDSRSGGYGTLTLQGVFEHSSNVGMAKCINHYYASNPSRFVDYVCKLGLNKELGLDIPGEARPLIKHPKLKNGWDGMTLTMMSYGYALRITPMQTLTIYNAVANGGMILRPRFVSELQQLGQTIKTYKNDTLISNICSPKTLELLQESMVGVVERGTAGLLKNKEYTVAAKTGTAQIAIGKHGYTAAGGGRHYLASLVGYFPAKNPRYTVLVAIKTFHRDGDGHPYYGGALSGPPFKTIINEIHKRENEFRTRTDNKIPIVGTPRSVLTALGGSSQELALLMREMKIKSALPVGGMSLIDSGVCCSFVPKSDSIATSVVGMSLREAVPMLERNGFKVLIHGKGRIVVQNYILDSLRGQKFVKLILE